MSDAMTYKGYIGSVHFSAEDEVFHGKIEAISDLIIKKAFHEAVDDYLETCEQMGREPQKPFKGSFNVRISPETHRMATMKASLSGISLNQFVQQTIEKAVTQK